MIDTSEKFKQAVYAPSRMIKARVRAEIFDITAFTDNTKYVSSEASISRMSQLSNKVRQMSHKYATCEENYTKLDGSFVVPPKAAENLSSELGWWSNTLSNDYDTFDTAQTIEFDFNNTHSSMGLTIYFDTLNAEYATDFDIDIYDTSDAVIAHESITDNTEPIYVYISQLVNYKKVLITISKWCKPYRRAKVVEVDFGIIKVYEDENLMKVDLVQELDITSSTIPADELKVTVDNSDRGFDVMNPQGFYNFLNQGQEIYLEMGPELDNGDFEMVQIGKYYLKDWQSDPSGGGDGGNISTVTFTARDIIDSLTDDETENATVQNITLYDLAVQVLTACRITDYVLSDNLKLFYTKALYSKMSYKSLLQLIAIAGACVVYSDSQGKFRMEQLISMKNAINAIDATSEAGISNKQQIINNILSPSFNVATLERDRVLLDGSFKVPKEDMSGYEMGWVSDELSQGDAMYGEAIYGEQVYGVENVNGVFTNPQVLTLAMNEQHSSTNLQILFDVLNNEYAIDFEIQGYDANNALLFDESVTDNAQSAYLYQNSLLANSYKVVITISKWCKPYRRARIVEIGFDLPSDNITLDDMYVSPKISLSQAVKAVEVTYYPGDTLDTKSVYTATNSAVSSGATLKVDNSLINNQAIAQNVAFWLRQQSQRRANFEIDWRQNPALTLADKVSVQDAFGNNNIGNIIKQQFTYQGYLRSITNILGAL